MIFNKTEKQERLYLLQIIALLNNCLNTTGESVKEHVDTLAEYKDYLWSNKDIDPHEIRSMRESILNHFAVGQSVIDKSQRLSKILDIPYFGRIDFQERRACVRPIYIGIHTFHDSKSKTTLIFDWRTPIAGMYYDYELGQSSYQAPSGTVEGAISLKRQYRIRDGKMEFMIESALTVHDDILQKELSSNADDKMRNIVATIQREQNQIIRNEEARTLIIQGVAGSGKTSIALHRIAYLLYALKGNVSSKDILLISPNKVFADYIANVLPEMGEETVPESSMEHLFLEVLNGKYKCQNFYEQINELLTDATEDVVDRIQYKSTFDFISSLDQFILHIENNYFKAVDVKLTQFVTVPAEFIADQFRRFDRYPMRGRAIPMCNYILEMMAVKYALRATIVEKNLLKREIKKMFAANNDIEVYKDFFAWLGKPKLFKMRKNRTLEYSDLAPLAYIHIALEGNKGTHNGVKHLLIDEMQDYSPIQYKVINKLFPCRKTILGDGSQSVNPYGSSNADMIKKAFVSGEIMKLCKSYRSTFEISSFAQKIRPNAELVPVARHGEEPQILHFNSVDDEISAMTDLIATFRKSTYKSLGIICKTESQAKALADRLMTYDDDIFLLSSQSSALAPGVVITSAHMAKGLEFDEVIIPQVDDKNYRTEMDRSMLYVAVTRAMHRLNLTYCGGLSTMLKSFTPH